MELISGLIMLIAIISASVLAFKAIKLDSECNQIELETLSVLNNALQGE